ncbi:RNA polymerase sigma factor [Bacteroidota bacterium]
MTSLEFQYKLINLQGNLTKFAYSLTSDKDDAKDLVQETLLKALKNRDKFEPESNIRAWIFTIMRNTFINNYRYLVQHKTYNYQAKEGFYLDYLHVSFSNPDSIYASKELEKTIEELDHNIRLPFKMHKEGFKYKEIAEKLDLKLGTVKSRIFIARKRLMSQLIEYVE